MSLSFTDANLRIISKQVLEAPAELVQDNNNLDQAIAKKADFLEKDNANKVYFDNFQTILNSYSEERKWIDGNYYTQYSEASSLIPSARQDNNSPHYPVSPTVWTKLTPKLIPSNNGSPGLTIPSGYESALQSPINTAITLLKTGFADGAVSTTLDGPYTPTALELNSTAGIAPGHRLVISAAGNSISALVTVLTVTTSPVGVTCTEVVAPAGGLGTGATVRNFFVGFSNLQREAVSHPYPEIFDYYANQIDTGVANLENSLNNQKAAVDANPAIGTEATQNTSASGHLATAIAAIDSWQAKPLTGTGVGKYGDTSLTILTTMMTTRGTQYPTRITQITSSFGSVSQAGDGSYSGSGHWYSLYKWIDLRAGKTGGSLFGFYNTDLIITFLQQKIVMTQNKIAEFDASIIVKDFAADATGTDTVQVTGITGLSVSDTVKVVTDDVADPVLTLQIIGITGMNVQLSGIVSAAYTVSKLARLVKVL